MKSNATTLLCTALSLSSLAFCACSNDDGGADGGGEGGATAEDAIAGAPDAWLGDDPHLDLRGLVDGRVLELSAEGSEAADIGTVYCERNYIVPDLEDTSAWAEEGYLEKVELKFNFFFDDALSEFQMEFVAPNLTEKVSTTFDVPDDAEVNVGLAVDEDGPNAAEYADTATSGSATLEALGGDVGDDGLTIADDAGNFGLYVDVELASGGAFKGSFTVNCGENDLETPE